MESDKSLMVCFINFKVIKGILVCPIWMLKFEHFPCLPDTVVIPKSINVSKQMGPRTSCSGNERVMIIVPLPILPEGKK
jgi:hypothetical protein